MYKKAMRGNLKVFSTRSMKWYADKVIGELNKYAAYKSINGSSSIQGNLKVSLFADGELEVEADSSVRGKDVFLFANAARNPDKISVDQNKIEIYNAVDALRRAQADRITLFEPYCSPGRSDRTTRRNSVGLWVHFKTLMALGVNHIITYDLHCDKSRSIIDPTLCAIDDVPVTAQLKKYLANNCVKTIENLDSNIRENWVICSVDAGGEVLAKKFAGSFNLPLVIAHKQRDYSKVNQVTSVKLLSDVSIEDKDIWIVDDMIDTGGSIHKLILELSKKNVKSVNIAIMHPVLSGPAINRLKELEDKGFLQNILVADTINCDDLINQLKTLKVVQTEKLSAEIVYRLNKEMSLSSFFKSFNVYEYLGNNTLFK